jgi:chromosome segregation ATPase
MTAETSAKVLHMDLETRVAALETDFAGFHASNDSQHHDMRVEYRGWAEHAVHAHEKLTTAKEMMHLILTDVREIKETHGKKLDYLTATVGEHTEKLDTLTATVGEHTEKLDTLTTRVDSLSTRVDGIGATVDTHTEILGEHTRILGEHTQILGEHTQKLDEHGTLLRQILAKVS